MKGGVAGGVWKLNLASLLRAGRLVRKRQWSGHFQPTRLALVLLLQALNLGFLGSTQLSLSEFECDSSKCLPWCDLLCCKFPRFAGYICGFGSVGRRYPTQYLFLPSLHLCWKPYALHSLLYCHEGRQVDKLGMQSYLTSWQVLHGEKVTWPALLYAGLGLAFWLPGLYFFSNPPYSSDYTPAESRAQNKGQKFPALRQNGLLTSGNFLF